MIESLFGIDYTILLRILAATLLGFALGLERELTNKYAGLRTHILVCLGACIFTILSIYGFPTFAGGDNFNTEATGVRDTARIAAQIVTGIGFIGAGTVMRNGSSVHGLTTAATLWIAASIGMACGAACYNIAILATLSSVCVLVLIRIFERNVLTTSNKNLKRLKINICCQKASCDSIHKHIIEKYPHLYEISRKNKENEEITKIVATLDVNGRKPIRDLYKSFQSIKGIESISIQDTNE